MTADRADLPTVPWSASQARATAVVLAGGAALLIWSWYGSSGTTSATSQAHWLIVGIFALVAIGFGNFVWLSGARRSLRQRQRQLAEKIDGSIDDPNAAGTGVPRLQRFVVVTGARTYHVDDCMLVLGKPSERFDASDHHELAPCDMCQP
jgi:hypothetical protein